MSVNNPQTRTLTIVNKKGLHARAAAKFVKLVETLDAHVEVTRNGTTVTGTSIMGLMMLAAAPGTTIDVSADGEGIETALDQITALVSSGFGEELAD